MILVAIIAMLLGRSLHLKDLSRSHAQEIARLRLTDLDVYLTMTAAGPGGTMHPDSGHPIAKWKGRVEEFISYHWELERKYDMASRHPWLPVMPDPRSPPEPSKAHMELYRKLLKEN